jgi:hypothetical protein
MRYVSTDYAVHFRPRKANPGSSPFEYQQLIQDTICSYRLHASDDFKFQLKLAVELEIESIIPILT